MKNNKRYALLLVVFLILCLILTMGVANYIEYDNNRVIVIRQIIEIQELAPDFDGFTILQISDLHGKRFGENQEDLVNLINSLDYDLIVFTGDMNHYRHEDNAPFLELLRGITNKNQTFFTAGNTGPFDVDMLTGSVTTLGFLLKNEGVIILNQPYPITRGERTIWISEYFSAFMSDELLNDAWLLLEKNDFNEKNHLTRWSENAEKLKGIFRAIPPQDTLIAVTHYPLSPRELNDPAEGDYPSFDLVLAGHYHGGQIRIPLIGALYVPEPDLPLGGLFPPQEIVNRLQEGKKTTQYISRGLGASSRIHFLSFRLFNSPEINLITLKRR